MQVFVRLGLRRDQTGVVSKLLAQAFHGPRARLAQKGLDDGCAHGRRKLAAGREGLIGIR